MGATLLTETLQRRPEVGFPSYDRMFPSQDTLPKGGFGNLIALPLQRRARDYGTASSWTTIFFLTGINGHFLARFPVSRRRQFTTSFAGQKHTTVC